MSNTRDALMTQAHTLHHSTCSQVKRLKNPIRVEVCLTWNTSAGYRFDVDLPSGDRTYAFVADCCAWHYRVKEVRRWIWEDNDE